MNEDDKSMTNKELIERRFMQKPTNDEQRRVLLILRDLSMAYAEALREHCPPCRERYLAEMNAEQASMWAEKSVTQQWPTKPQG